MARCWNWKSPRKMRSFFLAEKHRDAAMVGQTPRDFLSAAFFGKRSTRPTDPRRFELSFGAFA